MEYESASERAPATNIKGSERDTGALFYIGGVSLESVQRRKQFCMNEVPYQGEYSIPGKIEPTD